MPVAAINAALRRVPSWVVYGAGALPAAWVWYLGLTGQLGPEPIKALERSLGETGLQFLVAGLAVTPLRRFLGVNFVKFRRALGLLCFFYVLQHLMVWLVLDVGDASAIWADIVKRPYVTAGMAAFALLIPLALTSADRAVRRLGPVRWRRLHRLVYPAALLAALHYVLLVKGWPAEPFLYGAVILGLLGLRLLPRQGASIPAAAAAAPR